MYIHIQTFFSLHNKYCIYIVLIFSYVFGVDGGPYPLLCVWGAPACPKSTGPSESSLAPERSLTVQLLLLLVSGLVLINSFIGHSSSKTDNISTKDTQTEICG